MKRLGALLFVGSMVLLSSIPVRAAEGIRTAVSAQELKLRSSMNSLFTQALGRQRNLGAKMLAGSEDSGIAVGQLSDSLDKIDVIFKTYYGAEAGDKITGLLKQYYQIPAVYADTIKKKGDTAAVVASMQAKADEITNLLNSYSGTWKKSGLADALNKYSNLSLNEIDMQRTDLGKPDAKILAATFGASIELSGAFVTGIVKQFPEQFKQ